MKVIRVESYEDCPWGRHSYIPRVIPIGDTGSTVVSRARWQCALPGEQGEAWLAITDRHTIPDWCPLPDEPDYKALARELAAVLRQVAHGYAPHPDGRPLHVVVSDVLEKARAAGIGER